MDLHPLLFTHSKEIAFPGEPLSYLERSPGEWAALSEGGFSLLPANPFSPFQSIPCRPSQLPHAPAVISLHCINHLIKLYCAPAVYFYLPKEHVSFANTWNRVSGTVGAQIEEKGVGWKMEGRDFALGSWQGEGCMARGCPSEPLGCRLSRPRQLEMQRSAQS